MLKTDERIDDLQVDGLKIIQNKKWFSFGIDAVLLANYTEIKKNENILDLGTGTGIIPLLIYGKSGAENIVGLEIQEEVGQMAMRSIQLNGLEKAIKIQIGDLKQIDSYFKKGEFDVITSNPPYFKAGGGILNETNYKTISRHEVACTLEDLFEAVYHALKPNGRFYMVHRPDRLVDIIELARKMRLEPKSIQFVQAKASQKPNIMLMKFVKFGNRELKFEDPIIVYDDKGNYTQEIYDIYRKTSITVFGEKE